MTEMELITNKKLREQNMDRIYVLNKVKTLMTVPKTDYVTSQMVANYYEVSCDTIRKIVMRHRGELVEDGVRCMSPEDFVKGHDVTIQAGTNPGYKHVIFQNALAVDMPNRGMMIYPRRAVLRIGMLLRDSEIARAIRTALLDIEEEKTSCVVDSRDDYLKTVIDRQQEQINTLIGLVEKLTTAYLPQKTPMLEEKPKAFVKLPKKSRNAWYAEVNNLIRKACAATYCNQNEVLCHAYKRLNSQYGLCLEQYRKDLIAQRGGRVTMLDTIYWVETEKNPNTAGLLAGVLTTFCDERKAS